MTPANVYPVFRTPIAERVQLAPGDTSHAAVGWTALACVLIAMLTLTVISNHRAAPVVLVLLAIPVVVIGYQRPARFGRDHPPS